MRLVYLETTGEIIGTSSIEGIDEHEGQGYIDIPDGFDWEERQKWVYDSNSGAVVLRTGSALIEAEAEITGRVVQQVIARHAGSSVAPKTLGHIESVVDILVQAINRWRHNETMTDQEKAQWDSFYTACSPHFRTTFDQLSGEEEGMRDAKIAARTVETNIKEDPELAG